MAEELVGESDDCCEMRNIEVPKIELKRKTCSALRCRNKSRNRFSIQYVNKLYVKLIRKQSGRNSVIVVNKTNIQYKFNKN